MHSNFTSHKKTCMQTKVRASHFLIPAILNKEILDGIIQVSKDDAYAYTQRAAKEEGILMGVSSGAVLAAVAKKLPEISKGAKILTFNYDTGERYLSIEGLF